MTVHPHDASSTHRTIDRPHAQTGALDPRPTSPGLATSSGVSTSARRFFGWMVAVGSAILPISTNELRGETVIAAAAVVVATLVVAVLGGILGHRYHDRFDRAVRSLA